MSEDLTLATLAVPDDPESDEDQEPSLVWGRLIPLQRDLPDICKSSFLSLHGFRHPKLTVLFVSFHSASRDRGDLRQEQGVHICDFWEEN